MGKFTTAIGVLFLLALGCQSTPLPAPLVNQTDRAEWLKNYRQAKELKATEKVKSCMLFMSLSEQAEFPLRSLAGLHAREVCPPQNFAPLEREKLPVYLRDLALEIEWQIANSTQDIKAQMELANDKSKMKLPQSEKIKWVQLAIEKAKALNLPPKAKEYEERLFKIAPRFDPKPKPENWPQVAQDLRMSRRFAEANSLYEKVIASKKFKLEDRISCFKGLRLSAKNERKSKEHIELSHRYVDFLSKQWQRNKKNPLLTNSLYEAKIYLARALWTAGESSSAAEELNNTEKIFKGRLSMAEVYWIKARMAEERAQPLEESKLLDLALKEKVTNPDLKDKIYWYAAWNARQQKQLEKATELFYNLSLQTQSDTLKARSMFWQGRTLLDLKKSPEAKAVFEDLMSTDPLGYYGMLAHQIQGIGISMPKSASDSTPAQKSAANISNTALSADLSNPLDSQLAEWLYWTKENDVLTDYLDYISNLYRKNKNQSEAVWTDIFKYYARAGLYVKLYENLSSLDGEKRKSILEKHPDLLFPQPWIDHVRNASLQFGIDEEFIYAIMRQESAFDPMARSGADAFGLMQVLPEVGQQIAEQHKIPYSDMEDLYSPAINISVGAAHLKELMERHRGQFILAVASYNASEGAIRNWMKNRFRGDSLEFIEEIPYEETRTYVRLVMRNMIFYRLLKSQSASIEFPNWVLKLDAG